MKQKPARNVIVYLRWATPSLWHGLHAYARDANWLMMGSDTAWGLPSRPRNFDGAIVLISEEVLFDVRHYFPGAKIVDIRGCKGLKPDGLVTIDHERVGHLSADYMHAIGCRSFIGLDLKQYWRGPRERVNAYGERLRELGVPPENFSVMHYDGWREYSYEQPELLNKRLRNLLKNNEFPVGLFAPEGYAANIILQAVLNLGYSVPDDIAILSSDNDRSICDMARIPISSVDVNLSKLGYEAARMLDRLMDGDPTCPEQIVIPPLGIEKRLSTEGATNPDPIVSAIRAYILEHYMERITAEHIIRDIHVSRSNAFARFRKSVGRSIGEEIERVRLERAKSLLETTDYKIDAVARLSGYQNTPAFCRMFKVRTGYTPSEIRRKVSS